MSTGSEGLVTVPFWRAAPQRVVRSITKRTPRQPHCHQRAAIVQWKLSPCSLCWLPSQPAEPPHLDGRQRDAGDGALDAAPVGIGAGVGGAQGQAGGQVLEGGGQAQLQW